MNMTLTTALFLLFLAAPAIAGIAPGTQADPNGDFDCGRAEVYVESSYYDGDTRACVVKGDPTWGTFVVVATDCQSLSDGTSTCCNPDPLVASVFGCEDEVKMGYFVPFG